MGLTYAIEQFEGLKKIGMEANTRLSRKAQEKAAMWANTFDQVIRIKASNLATIKGKEFADEADVEEAYKLVILSMAKDISQ